ncbi:MAG: hypothetical protein ACT4RN_01770 [Pseudonocardia sp.]
MQVIGAANSGLLRELRGELVQLANRQISDALHSDRGQKPLDIPHLISLAQLLETEQWSSDSTGALTSIIKRATNRLPARKICEGTDATWRQFAFAAYNLSGQSMDHVDGKKYTHLLREFFDLASLRDLSDGTRRNYAHDLRSKLAAALLKMKHEYLAEVASSSSLATEGEASNRLLQLQSDPPRCAHIDAAPRWTSSYVSRADIQEQFNSHVSAGQRLITLVGQPGSGKSRTAYEFAVQHAQDAELPGVWLDGSSEYLLRAGIIRYLRLVGAEIPEATDELYLSFFAMLCGSTKVSVVVIDNVSSSELLLRVVPRPPSALVLVTSEEALRSALVQDQVKVSPMAEAEAEILVRQLLPQLTAAQRHRLAMVLGCLPLAITHTAGLLNGQFGINSKHLLDLLDEDPADVFGVELGEHRALSIVYGSIVARLLNESPGAWRTLSILTAVRASPMPFTLISDLYSAVTEEADNRAALSGGAIAGLATLERMQLVQASDRGLTMNPLARRLIAHHLREQHVHVTRSAYVVVRDMLSAGVSESALSALRDSLYLVALDLVSNDATDTTGLGDRALGELLAEIATELNRRGGSNELLRWLVRSPLAKGLTRSGRLATPEYGRLVAQLQPALITGIALSPDRPEKYDGEGFLAMMAGLVGDPDRQAVAARPATYFFQEHGLGPVPPDKDIHDIHLEFPRDMAVYEHGELSFLEDSARWFADHGSWDEADKRYDALERMAAAPDIGESCFDVQALLGKAAVAVWRRRFGGVVLNLAALSERTQADERILPIQDGLTAELSGDFFRLMVCESILEDGVLLVDGESFDIGSMYTSALECYGSFNDHTRMATAELKLAAHLACRDVAAGRDRISNVGNYLAPTRPGHLRRTVLSLKLQLLSGKFRDDDYELAWKCAALATRTMDWYWRAEALLLALMGSRQIRAAKSELDVLDQAVRHAYGKLQRPDRIRLIDCSLASAVDRVDLLTD